jgi:exo-1,4-beta-D-glucosaminidase
VPIRNALKLFIINKNRVSNREKTGEFSRNQFSHRPKRRACTLFLLLSAALPQISTAQSGNSRIDLRDGWSLQSSCKISAKGAQLSSVGFNTNGWHRARVPTTVLAALVADGTYPDPYVGENLRSIPGESYSTDQNFVLQQMPADSPFRCSWWYRTEFSPAPAQKDRRIALHFDGINNRANIWLNGKKIADAANITGADRSYEFDVTGAIRPDAPNALAVEVFAQTPNDFGIDWIDWNPAPPDKDMGLWRDAYVAQSGPVEIRHPQVVTHLLSADVADLTVEAELRNLAAQKVSGTLSGDIEGIAFQRQISLAASVSRNIRFTSAECSQLRIENPKLWWPAQMGEPTLHNLHLRFAADGTISDDQTLRFGVREIASTLDDNGNRLFLINGRKIFIRGAGWAPDMLLRESPDRLRAEFRYIRDLNLNTIRLEGKLESDEFYELADEQGILVMPGWSCCDLWQDGAKWTPAQMQIATESLRSQLLRLRSHPSVLAWLNGSDAGPPPNVESAFMALLKEADWPNPVLFSAADEHSEITGATGVKMTGPYDYVPPDFWLADDGTNGGATGFNTETSPGPAIPPKTVLEKILGGSHLQPGDPTWTFHTAQGTYNKLDHFNEAMSAIYGPPADLDDYERKAQAMAYDSERAMFEAYTRNKYSSTTGIIQWMLNNAWPSLYWHLYDYYLQPAGGYFGAKKALEPVHVQYSYDDRSVVVVNSSYTNALSLKVGASVYDGAMRPTFSRQTTADVSADSVAKVLTIPQEALGADSPVRFLRLTLTQPDGQIASTNFYWLSSQKNVYDWSQASFRFTPVANYEDFKPLLGLKTLHLTAVYDVKSDPESPLVKVSLQNPTNDLAFQIHLGIRRKGEDSEVLPVIWSDNYFELMPGESREVSATCPSQSSLDGDFELVITGWNISELTVPLTLAK